MDIILALVFCLGISCTISENVDHAKDARLKRFIFQGGGGGGGGFPQSPFSGGSGGTSGSNYHACVPSQSVCHLQCANGYMKGPNNCDFCVCSASHGGGDVTTSANGLVTQDLTVSGSTLPPHSTRDPCLLAKTLCSSRCGAGGYLADPDDCTFCVCKSDIESSG